MHELTRVSNDQADLPQVGAAAKALLLLGAFESRTEVVGVSQLARRLSFPKSTVHRVLRVLVDAGFVHQLPSGYQLSDQAARLGSSAVTRSVTALRTLLLPCLVDFHQATGAPVSLSVVEGGLVRCVEKVHGMRQGVLAQAFPDDVPAHRSVAGSVLLAFGASRCEEGIGDLARLHLDRVKTQGVAVEPVAGTLGFSTVVVPILDADRRAAAALSALVPASPARLESLTTRLRSAAHTCGVILTAHRRRATTAVPAA
ncbi:helix-turn-helix domain-containing protein [Lentzea sp. HUAS12]|uniref:helix-turn-helix domain-containing protein n=1 Tax=Lentzea sp. HUAS12 TaxID=2951806 RepID=UPI00209E50F4|nr:helix-turn-helix domain-containing protein [Lentzea sp. HUAS12]USX52831.1 helix-turn-helix domain-containing protein [Lentzea sp. HUAS12]